MPASYWKTGVRTGGKVVIELDGQPIAFAQSARFRDDYGLEPIHIIGQLQTIEYVPMHARHEIQIATLVLNRVSLAAMGLEPPVGGSFGVFDNQSKTMGPGIVKQNPNGRFGPDITNATWAAKFNENQMYDTAVQQGKAASTDGSVDANIYTVLHQKVFDIKVWDAEPNRVEQKPSESNYSYAVGGVGILLWYKNCFYAGGDVSIDANRALVHNVTFYAQDKDQGGSSLRNRNGQLWTT